MSSIASSQVAGAVGVIPRLRRLGAYRELTWMLTWRDIRVRYKHSMLGAAWAVIPPVMMMGIFTFVFGTVSQLNPQTLTGHASLPYSLFALSGLVPWTFFANSLQAATISLVSNRQLITKIYFPREVFPVAAVGSAFIDFVISTVVLVAFALFVHFGGGPWRFEIGWPMLALPVVIVVQLALTVGIGLLLSMANLFYRDVGFLFRSFIQLWMFVTCVVYQLEPTAAWKRAVIQLNPMTPIIRAYRDCLLMNRNPFDWNFIQASLFSVAVLALGWLWFSRREFDFAERA